jgi:hypothetical protein
MYEIFRWVNVKIDRKKLYLKFWALVALIIRIYMDETFVHLKIINMQIFLRFS